MIRPFNILACDPSIDFWGYAVLNSESKILTCGCIRTELQDRKHPSHDRCRRISEINQALIGIIRQYEIKHIVSELPHGSQSYSAAIMIGITNTIGQAMADCFGLKIDWFLESQSKKNMFGRCSNVTKDEMKAAVAKVFPGRHWKLIKYHDEAVADALAVYLLAKKRSSIVANFHK